MPADVSASPAADPPSPVASPAVPLSIVVPVLDEAAGIAAALSPLQPLRQAGVEVIVVDGGSCDATPALAERLADLVLVAPRGRGSPCFPDDPREPREVSFGR